MICFQRSSTLHLSPSIRMYSVFSCFKSTVAFGLTVIQHFSLIFKYCIANLDQSEKSTLIQIHYSSMTALFLFHFASTNLVCVVLLSVVSGRHVSSDGSFMGNNNFLYVTDKTQRDIVADISCEFRARPLRSGRLNYTTEESGAVYVNLQYFLIAVEKIDFSREWEFVMDVPALWNGESVSDRTFLIPRK